jgi:hypothetical protein
LPALTWEEQLLALTGVDVLVCRHCGSLRVERRALAELDTG